ncbi:nucleotidyltransferase family protein [bacterium]|nr:nucleotidyltransferase family protein [bacterium]
MKKLAIVILAAGCSSRLGQPKQLVPFKQSTLLSYQCNQALLVTNNVSCVFGFDSEIMKEEINDLAVESIINSAWQSGLSSSITEGVRTLGDHIDGVMLLLVDQWQLTKSDLQQLVQVWEKEPHCIITASQSDCSDEFTGPPVIFPRRFFMQLINNEQANGAKQLLNQYRDDVIKVNLPHTFIDLDTPEQLRKMNQYLASND